MARVDETVGAGHPRLSDVQPEPGDAGLHHAQLPGVPRPADLASDPARRRTRRSCAPMPTRQVREKLHAEAVERKVPIQRRRVLEDLVGLHVGQRAGAGEEQAAAVQDASARSPRCRASASSTRSSIWWWRRISKPRFLQAENNVDDEALREDPDLSERDHRPGRRRRARAVPRRLRLHHAAAGRVGAREAGDDAGTGGAAADVRVGVDCSASTTAACCGRAWRRTS